MKKIIPLLICAALLLAACQGQATPQPATQVPPTETASPTETVPPTSAYPTSSAPPGCTVVSPRPTPGPTEESLFPPVSDSDWIQGPKEARITLIEYSDFQ